MIPFPEEQINELKSIAPNLSVAQEGGYTYLFIKDLRLPEYCDPAVVDALFCPTLKDGYNSRLYLPQIIGGIPSRNWNSNLRALERNWYAISWQMQPGLRLAEMLINHLKALR